jgi:rod shape-determining protein MreD
MINNVIKHSLQFVVLIFIQVLLIKNLELGRFINPFVYVLFILSLPLDTPKWLLLTSAFFIGLSVDVFYDTAGMNAAASVFMAFARPWALRIFEPRGGYLQDHTPTVLSLGIGWYLSYASLLIFLHHLVLFYLEVFHIHNYASTFTRVFISSVFTLVLVLLGQYLLYRKKA